MRDIYGRDMAEELRKANKAIGWNADAKAFDKDIASRIDFLERELATLRGHATPNRPDPMLDDNGAIKWDVFVNATFEEQWLVDEFWPVGRVITVFTKGKQGKSLFLMYVAFMLAQGFDPFTRKPQEPIVVSYFDGEMSMRDIHSRLWDMDGLDPDRLENLKYHPFPSIPKLDTPQGGLALNEIVRRDESQAAIIDPIARFISGKENDNDTYRDLFAYSLAPLKARDISVIRSDHQGHDDSNHPRGASSKSDDIDVEWNLKRAETKRGMSWTLKVTAERIGIGLDKSIAIEATNDPLGFRRVAYAYPPGTAEMAKRLDDAGMPIEISRRKWQTHCKGFGVAAGDVLAIDAAIRFRRERSNPLFGI